jgi:hypothetical protein
MREYPSDCEGKMLQRTFATPSTGEAFMKDAVRGHSSGRGKAEAISDPGRDDPHDGIEAELLELWLGLSWLQERINTGGDRRTHRLALTSGKPPGVRKPRRKAA